MKKTAFILFVFLIFWADALYASDRDVRRLIGRRITVPEGIVALTADGFNKDIPVNLEGLSLIAYYGHMSCSTCSLQSLKYFKALADECGACFIPILFPDSELNIRAALYDLRVSFPVYYDMNDDFVRENRLNVKASYRIFLLDKKGRIVVVGDPIGNAALEDLYRRRAKDLR